MRVISVVIGEENSANRFEDIRTSFDYAFANYVNETIAEGGVPLDQPVSVSGGKEKNVSVCPARSAYVLTKRGEKSNVSVELY